MTGLASTPEFIPPKRPAQIVLTLTETDPDARPANFVRVWCTVAPPGSEFAGKLESTQDPRNRVLAYQGGGGSAFPWSQTFDKGGKYTFAVQEYVRGGDGGPAYEGDPNASDNETKAGAETALTIYVGQRVTMPIGPAQDRATLVLFVWNETIKETTEAFHGEASPAIVATGTPTPRVATAINSASVEAALADLIDSTTDYALGDIPALVADYVDEWNDHLSQTDVHNSNDADNMLPVGLASASTPKNFQRFIGEALKYMRRHFTNDNEEGIDSEDYHEVTVSVNDWVNMPLYEGAGTLAESVGAFADLHRCYEAHRVSVEPSGVHAQIDSTNTLTALPSLLAVHSAFLTVLASSSPTVPPAQSSGVQQLVSGAGFTEG